MYRWIFLKHPNWTVQLQVAVVYWTMHEQLFWPNALSTKQAYYDGQWLLKTSVFEVKLSWMYILSMCASYTVFVGFCGFSQEFESVFYSVVCCPAFSDSTQKGRLEHMLACFLKGKQVSTTTCRCIVYCANLHPRAPPCLRCEVTFSKISEVGFFPSQLIVWSSYLPLQSGGFLFLPLECASAFLLCNLEDPHKPSSSGRVCLVESLDGLKLVHQPVHGDFYW